MNPKNIIIPNRKPLEEQYEAQRPKYEKILNALQQKMNMIMTRISIHPTIKVRVKSFEGYYNKILRNLQYSQTHDQVFNITDILGMRIVLPFLEDLHNVEALIREKLQVVELERKGSHHSFKEFGYESIHFLIKIPNEILSQFQVRSDLVYELQLRTLLQDAWAEVEHELVYKVEFTPFDEHLKRKLAALNANLTLSDIIFQEIRDYQQQLRAQLKKRRKNFFEKIQADTAALMTSEIMEEELSGRKHIQEKEIKKKKKIGKKFINNIDDLLLEALYAHNSNRFKMAVEIYTSILKLEPQKYIQSIIHLHRGMAYVAESNYSQALEDFSAALELDQENLKAYYYRGVVHYILQNYPQALEDFNRCLELNPCQYDPLYSRAQIYFCLGNYPQALVDCEQALNIKPESAQAQKFKILVQSRMHL